MADMAKECINTALEKLNILRNSERELILRKEQEIAIENLLLGNNVLAVLPTGFGKSMIFTLFLLARQELETRRMNTDLCLVNSTSSILIITPLTSITSDQIAEMESLGLKALELSDETLKEIIQSRPQFIYSSAEMATSRSFLDILQSELHETVVAIVVDESHTVETWTGKRKSKGKCSLAFRSAFGRLSLLRSMCNKDCPLLALTGTADENTQDTICKELLLKHPCKLFVSPNRSNLRFSVSKVKKKNMLPQLEWLISMVKEHGINMPKTIIFCDTIYAIANVANYMMMQLGCSAFHPLSSTKRENCLIGIIHSATQKEYKKRLLESLKEEGTKRIAIATTSLSMGVNFPNIRYIVMFGLPRSMLDLHQEAGRGGRDGLPTDVCICFYGQQVSHCDSVIMM